MLVREAPNGSTIQVILSSDRRSGNYYKVSSFIHGNGKYRRAYTRFTDYPMDLWANNRCVVVTDIDGFK